jgi:hypothetical protein
MQLLDLANYLTCQHNTARHNLKSICSSFSVPLCLCGNYVLTRGLPCDSRGFALGQNDMGVNVPDETQQTVQLRRARLPIWQHR